MSAKILADAQSRVKKWEKVVDRMSKALLSLEEAITSEEAIMRRLRADIDQKRREGVAASPEQVSHHNFGNALLITLRRDHIKWASRHSAATSSLRHAQAALREAQAAHQWLATVKLPPIPETHVTSLPL